MKSKLWLIICSFLLAACTSNANNYIFTPTITHITQTTQKNPTISIIPTRTPSLTTGCVNINALNVRAGPDVEYSIIGGLSNGECATIKGCNANSSWVWVESQDLKGWVYAGYLSVIGDLARVPETENSIIPPSNATVTSNSNEPTQPFDSPTVEYQPTQLISSPTVGNEGCPYGCTFQKDGCDIKGNISFDTNEKIYHIPGQEFYSETTINPDYGERWFCTENEAIANGWRKSYK